MRLQLRLAETVEFPGDVARIKKVLAEKGYDATDHECALLWRLHSEKVCAAWLMFPLTDDSIFESVQEFIVDPEQQVFDRMIAAVREWEASHMDQWEAIHMIGKWGDFYLKITREVPEAEKGIYEDL